MSISQCRISYAVGTADWDSKAAQEGLPVLEHFEPEPVFDGSSQPETSGSYRMPSGQDSRIGPAYYICDIPLRFTPAHAILLLDNFFERGTVGESPNYDRIYKAEDIPGEPLTPYINLWKKTLKPGVDRNLCLYNGLVSGITFSMAPNSLLALRARCAFGARSMTEPSPGNWAINWTAGNLAPVRLPDIYFYISPPGGAPTIYRITDFEVTLSVEFSPHFWGSQGPDRWTRGKAALSGFVQLREISTQVETFTAWLESSSVRSFSIALGANALLSVNALFMAGGAFEDDITRRGKYEFSGVYESAAAAATAFQLFVRPGRQYTP